MSSHFDFYVTGKNSFYNFSHEQEKSGSPRSNYEKVVFRWHARNIGDDADSETELNERMVLYASQQAKSRTITSFTKTQKRSSNKAEFLSFASHRPVNMAFLLEMQKLLTEGTCDERRLTKGERSGAFKHYDYVAGKTKPAQLPKMLKRNLASCLRTSAQNCPRKIL